MTETSGILALKKESDSKYTLPAIRTRFSSAGSARCIVVLRQERRFNATNLHLYHYAGNNPIHYTDPTGMWQDNGDGTFTAQKGDTLWGLQQETGKDWHESDWDQEKDPRTLQIGDTVNMGKRNSKSSGAPEVSNTDDAVGLYFAGDGSDAWLSDSILDKVKNNATQQDKQKNRMMNGATSESEGNYGIDMTKTDSCYFIGNTRIDYHIYFGSKTTLIDFTAFDGDGFWDILGFGKDKKSWVDEVPFSKPYAFIPRSWSISFPNPQKMNWKK